MGPCSLFAKIYILYCFICILPYQCVSGQEGNSVKTNSDFLMGRKEDFCNTMQWPLLTAPLLSIVGQQVSQREQTVSEKFFPDGSFLQLHLEIAPLLFKAQIFKRWPGLTSAVYKCKKERLTYPNLFCSGLQFRIRVLV